MHYMNGREAKVGDTVIGRTYNRQEIVAGTLVSVTPGPDSCSAKVGFLKLVLPVPAGYQVHSGGVVMIQGTEEHGAKGEKAATVYEEDYTECKNLLHSEDALGLSQMMMARQQEEVAAAPEGAKEEGPA